MPAGFAYPGRAVAALSDVSFRVRPGSKDNVMILASVEASKGRDMMSWLSVDYEKLSGRVLEFPTRANIPTKVSEQLIVELYSK